jgi:dipeptidyl aminopeptidase/acylaminoacyl peptidase
MSPNLDHLIRQVVHDMASEPASPDAATRTRIARAALAAGRRRRRQRTVTVAASVALVTTLALLTPYALRPTAGPAPGPAGPVVTPTSPDTTPTQEITGALDSPIPLVPGWVVLGNRRVLDATSGTYLSVSDDLAFASPDGRWAAFDNPDQSVKSIRIVDLQSGDSKDYTIPASVLDPQWSPDGSRLLLTAIPKSGTGIEMHLIDPATGAVTTQDLPSSFRAGTDCVYCALTWLPNGSEVALTLAHNVNEGRPEQPDGIQLFTLDGQPSRTLPVLGRPGGPGAWSPDGRHVVVTGVTSDGTRPEEHLVEVATGTVVRVVPSTMSDGWPSMSVSWIDSGRMISFEGSTTVVATLRSIDGTAIQQWTLPNPIVGPDHRWPAPTLATRL